MNQGKSFLLYGAGGHGKVIAEILERSSEQVLGFIDTLTTKKELLGYPVYQSAEGFASREELQFLISIGNNRARKELAMQLSVLFGRAIHPSAQLSSRTRTGEGTVIMAGVCVNSETKIGRHCILNTGCSVDHDCVLEDFVHLSPGVHLAGSVSVGEGTHIGTGASVIPGIQIGKWCTIGAGAAIIRNVPDYSTVVGVPGRIVKTEQ